MRTFKPSPFLSTIGVPTLMLPISTETVTRTQIVDRPSFSY